MTTLNDFSVADLTIDVLAIYYNKLLGSIFRKEFSNAVTMSTDLTLTDGDTPIQRLDCNGADRIAKVPVGAAGNHPFLLINTTSSGSWTLTVKSNDGTTVLKVLDPGEFGFFYPDGNGEYLDIVQFDGSVYLTKDGLAEWDEQASDPSTPASGKWKLYFKSGGLYLIDDAGVVLGPIDPSQYLTKDGLKDWDQQGSTPSSPAASKMKLYFKSDEKLYKKNPSGTEVLIDSRIESNLLINGGGDFFQRPATPTTVVSMTDDAYNAPDCWYSLIQGSGATITQGGSIGKSKNSFKLTAGGTTNRYGIAQIKESVDSIPLRGQTIIAQFLVKPVNNAGSGTRKYRIAILEWTGTADAVTSELVADWTSSTFTTSGFFASTSKVLVGSASVTVTHNTETVVSVSGAVSANCNNLIVFMWVEDVPTHASDYALVGEFGLYPGNVAQDWHPDLISEVLLNCQRFGEVSGSVISYIPVAGNKTVLPTIPFKVTKYGTPTVICTSNSGAANKVGEYNAAGAFVADWTEGLTSIDSNGFFYFATGGGLTAGNTLRFTWKAFSEL